MTKLATKTEVAEKLSGYGPEDRKRLGRKLERKGALETKGVPTREELAEAVAETSPKRVASRDELRRAYAGLVLQELQMMTIPTVGDDR